MTVPAVHDEALDLLSMLVLEDGRAWAEAAAPAQWEDAHAVLAARSDTPYAFLTRARGWSKTTDLAGMALAVMLTQSQPGDRLYALAADRDQGRLLVDAIRGFVDRSPALVSAVRVDQFRVTAGDVVLEVLAADAAGSYGLRPSFLIVDEIAQWPDTPSARRLWEATSSAIAKRPQARMVVLTTAGDPAHWSYQLREHARTDPLWRLHEVSGPAPWMDPARLAEQRRRLPTASYMRLFENHWTASEDRFTTIDDVTACLTHRGPIAPQPGIRYVIGVDLGLVNDRSVAVVAHLDRPIPLDATPSSSRVVVDRLEVWAGSRDNPVPLTDVEAWLLDSARAYDRAEIVLDPWQAAGMSQRLEAHRLTVHGATMTQTMNSRLASTLLMLLRSHGLALPHDPDLVDELTNLRIHEPSPGQYRIQHDANRHNDRAIALALAAERLLNTPPRRRARIIV